MKNKFIYFAILSAGLVACEPEFDNEVSDASYSAGDADFSTYVAIGNSLTAGFSDGTVSRLSQQYSYPNILAQQFAVVGGGAFTQPSYAEDVNNVGGLMLGGMPILDANGINRFPARLIINAELDPATGQPRGPQPLNRTSTIELTNLQAKAYNNMGVPGAKSFHLLAAGYGNLAGLATGQSNPYFVRHATSPTATVLGDAMSLNPTFFTNWIGSNDVLAYATSGGTGVNQLGNMNPATYGGNDITDPAVFNSVYTTIINALTANGAKGVVATIPNVTAIPYFTTVPYNPLTASTIGGGNQAVGEATIAQLNAQLYGPLSQALTAFGQGSRIAPLSTTAGNPLLIKDETLTNMAPQIQGALTLAGVPAAQAAAIGQIFGQARQATAADLVLLTTRSVIGTAPTPAAPAPFDKLGITYPLQDQHVLTAAEVEMVNTATTSFNNSIRAIAASKNLAVADMNAIMNQLISGLRLEDGQIYTANYFSTSRLNTTLFSLDGVHPNARGYAVVANEIIKVINSYYHAHLPLVSAAGYPGSTVLPNNNP
ncbi:G-D-S-L family lipolytic protein [Nostoc linckia z15]|nr:G-D-S-L family lipolytic protein [Nostoc linckia z15]